MINNFIHLYLSNIIFYIGYMFKNNLIYITNTEGHFKIKPSKFIENQALTTIN